MVKDLGSGMLQLEKCVSENDDDLYDEIRKMQSECLNCCNEIDRNQGLLTSISEEYDPRLYSVLMDLSTRQKPFFVDCEGDDKLLSLARSNTCKEIPDKVSDLFLNAVFIPNMIQKEVEYNKAVLNTLKGDVRGKQMLLSELKKKVPEKKSTFQVQNPIESFLRSLVQDEPREIDYSITDEESSDEEGQSEEGTIVGDQITPQGGLGVSKEEEIEKALRELNMSTDQGLREGSEVSEEEYKEEPMRERGGNYELSFY
jgi:hypothetical protein